MKCKYCGDKISWLYVWYSEKICSLCEKAQQQVRFENRIKRELEDSTKLSKSVEFRKKYFIKNR